MKVYFYLFDVLMRECHMKMVTSGLEMAEVTWAAPVSWINTRHSNPPFCPTPLPIIIIKKQKQNSHMGAPSFLQSRLEKVIQHEV